VGIGDVLKKLFGGTGSLPAGERPFPAAPEAFGSSEPVDLGPPRSSVVGVSRKVEKRYFELSLTIEKAKASGDFRSAIAAARETYPLLPAFVRYCKREYKRFDIRHSHAVHTVGPLMAVLGVRAGIQEMRSTLEAIPDLQEWLPVVEQAERDLETVPAILAAVEREPGLVQSDLKKRIACGEGARPGQLAAWLEKAGRPVRVKKGASHLLYLAGHAPPR
jgi:hypothetical protein